MGYKFVANTGQMKIDVRFGPEVTMGATVWLAAALFNSRKQLGPVSAPVQATIGAGSTLAMKLAA